MKTKKKRTAEERAAFIEAFKVSGQTQADFCRERNLDATTFSGWLNGKVRLPGLGRKKVKFACVEVPRSVTGGMCVELELPGSVRARITNADNEGIGKLLGEVAACYQEQRKC